MELNENGLRVWKHKTNKRLFLQQSYRCKDNLILLDETEGRQIIMSFKASSFDYSAWSAITTEEYSNVKKKFSEIWGNSEDRNIIPRIEEYQKAKEIVILYENEQKILYELRLDAFEKDLKDYFENNLIDNYIKLKKFRLDYNVLGVGTIIPIEPRME